MVCHVLLLKWNMASIQLYPRGPPIGCGWCHFHLVIFGKGPGDCCWPPGRSPSPSASHPGPAPALRLLITLRFTAGTAPITWFSITVQWNRRCSRWATSSARSFWFLNGRFVTNLVRWVWKNNLLLRAQIQWRILRGLLNQIWNNFCQYFFLKLINFSIFSALRDFVQKTCFCTARQRDSGQMTWEHELWKMLLLKVWQCNNQLQCPLNGHILFSFNTYIILKGFFLQDHLQVMCPRGNNTH